RRYDEAVPQLQRAAALEPGGAQEHNGLARVYAATGRIAEAIREEDQAVQLSGEAPTYLGQLARLYALSGEAGKARNVVARLQELDRGAQSHVPAQAFGSAYAALGDKDRAFSFLAQSVSRRETEILWAVVSPELDTLREDPRFSELLRRIGQTAG